MSSDTHPGPDPQGDVRGTVGKIGQGTVAGLLWVLSGIDSAGLWFGTNFWKITRIGLRKAFGFLKWVFNGGIGREMIRAITYTAIGIFVLSSMGIIKIT